MAKYLKHRISIEERLFYLRNENKGADQLRGHNAADLLFCLRICKIRFSHATHLCHFRSIPSKTGTVINPQNGDKRQSRNEDDPLPPTPGNTPGDYLELKVVDKYGYMEPVEKHKTISTPYSEPYSDNQATLYPHKTGEPPYKNQL